MRPRLLDLFCGAGGASRGYHKAGFDVTGVDNVDQPNYPFRFVHKDVFEALATLDLSLFAAIHASPPCQAYCAPTQYNRNRSSYPDLVAPVREMLVALKVPYIIENTPGAPLLAPIRLCGTMFGLSIYRHRLFESNVRLREPQHPKHVARCARNGVIPPQGGYFTITGGKHSKAWTAAAAAMGVTWMVTTREVCEAIPPAYTQYIGQQLLFP